VKVAVVDATGKVVATDTIYPHEPRRQWDESLAALARLCRAHRVELVAIGNGTASRETDKLAGELVAKHPDLKLTKMVVSEAGASVYSASAYASQELPDLDVSLRGAVSIARRLQDPLAELVKIDPKSIGVGQYQHDLAEHKLSRSLDAVVEDCVNAVGGRRQHRLAAAARPRSGLAIGGAEHRAHRDANGPFGPASLRRSGLGQNLRALAGSCASRTGTTLDASGVHPEAYPCAAHPAATKSDIRVVIGNTLLKTLNLRPSPTTVRLPTVTNPERAGKARAAIRVPSSRPPPSGGVENRRSQPAWCSKGWSPTWRPSAPSWMWACTRTGSFTSRRSRHLREGSPLGGEAGRCREGEGPGGRPGPQAHLAHHAHGRCRTGLPPGPFKRRAAARGGPRAKPRTAADLAGRPGDDGALAEALRRAGVKNAGARK
jgi:hypothetical protein